MDKTYNAVVKYNGLQLIRTQLYYQCNAADTLEDFFDPEDPDAEKFIDDLNEVVHKEIAAIDRRLAKLKAKYPKMPNYVDQSQHPDNSDRGV